MTLQTTRRRLLASGVALGATLRIGPADWAFAAGLEGRSSLQREFIDPPQAARPRVWWHWMNGNVSAEGARLDLEWMQRVGIGGVHAFAGGGLPAAQVVKPPVTFMSGDWQRAVRQSLEQALAGGMEFGIAGSPGWHVTGGPWVAPADGMKKYVWSEQEIEGGTPYRGKLAQPPTVTGPFQSKPGGKSKAVAYGDTAVIAFPTPRLERKLPAAEWISHSGPIDLTATSTGDLGTKGIKLALAVEGAETWVEARFAAPAVVGAIALSIDEGASVAVQAEDASGKLRTIREAAVRPAKESDELPAPQQTIAFAPISTRRLRLLLKPLPDEHSTALAAINPRAVQKAFTLLQTRWIGGARIDGFEAKAGFAPTFEPADEERTTQTRGYEIDSQRVIDLTRLLGADGALDWTPPPGRWTVIRFGWSLTGVVNGPAEPVATGLEVDKFAAAAVRRYLDHYLDLYRQATGREPGPAGIQTLLTDSWESKVQNWTPAMLTEFRTRRGYDATRFLPVLAGRVVDDPKMSERFLFDFRQTLKDLLADNHYGVIAASLKARGMTYYSEALGDNARAIADGMTIKARADIPTAEYWYRAFATVEGQPPLRADLEEAASAAHVYGKRLVAAEALTVAALSDAWAFSPAMLKPVADEIFARGINRILIHESHHQPIVEGKPGLQLFLWGQYFNRNDTWAEHAAPWVTYLARTSHMLQQGTFVADVAYFYGEERNLTELFLHGFNTEVPRGYKYDYINPEALLTLLSVKNGRVVTPSGMSYAVLFMPDHVQHLSLPAIRKLRDLVRAGAVLVGEKPSGGLGVMSADVDVNRIADELWGDGHAPVRRLGKGRVHSDLARALEAERIAPDVTFDGADAGEHLLHLHRRTEDAEIYYVSNQSNKAVELNARFRVAGYAPEIWRAETGAVERASYRQIDGAVIVPLALDPHEALFVIFRQPSTSQFWSAPIWRREELARLTGPWQISFEPGLGAPATATFDTLISWPDSLDPGIKYFSGRATYKQELHVTPDQLVADRRIELDLGEVRDLAVISVNGRRIATAWKPPYRVDVTSALKPGSNMLEIAVINLWPNRLIGDRQPGATSIAFAPDSRYAASSPLLRSGLLGPVRLDALGLGK